MATTRRPVTVTMRACRMDFAACLTAASEGHVVVITRRGQPVAQLVAFGDRPRILKKLGVKRLPRPIGG